MTIIIPVLLLGLTPMAWSADLPTLRMREGEQRLLHFPGLRRYSASGTAFRMAPLPSGLETTGLGAPLLVKAVHAGVGELWVWTTDGGVQHRSIEVFKTEVLRPADFELALSRLDEVEILGTPAGKSVLQGSIRTKGECARIRALKLAFGAQVIDESLPTEALADQAWVDLEKWRLASPWATRLRLERLGRSVQVRGSVTRAQDREPVERQAAAIFGCAQIVLLAPADESPTISFRVFLLEVRKDRLSSLGLGWPANQTGAFRVSPWGIQRNLTLDVAIQMLEGDGSARVLSSPELVVRAPGEAELFAGGEIPIRATSQYSSQVTWRPYGLTFKLIVGAASEDRVRVDILTEVSHLSETIGGEAIPGVQSNRMRTQVDARYGEPLLLSGLLRRETREQARGLPGLRSLPILGTLFGSKDFLEARSELVAILIPNPRAPTVSVPDVRGPIPAAPWDSIGREKDQEPRAPVSESESQSPPLRHPRLHRWFPS